jgi:fido (protein-threonine AMPylation protein)
VTDLFEEPDNATPLTLEERRDLIPAHLHGHMFGDVWRWAGRFRTSERNLGIVHHGIPVALRQLLDDSRAWLEHRA